MGPPGAAGPQGQAGTFGSITTESTIVTIPGGMEANLFLTCDTGTPISGGTSHDPIVGVFVVSDSPSPFNGTPTAWQIEVGNTAGGPVQAVMDVVCVTPTGSTAGAASRAHHPRIVKETVVKLTTLKGQR